MDPLTAVPVYDTGVRRRVFRYHTLRRPRRAVYRGREYTVSASQPSMQRRMQAAGFLNEIIDLEVFIALEPGDSPPQPGRADDFLLYDEATESDPYPAGHHTYRIVSVDPDTGANCWHLNLALRR